MSSIPGGAPLPPSSTGATSATTEAVGGRVPSVGTQQGRTIRTADPVDAYAEAIVTVAAAEGVLERVEAELYEFAGAIKTHPELAQRMSDPSLDDDTKTALVGDILTRAHPQTLAAVRYVILGGRARFLDDIAGAVARIAAERRNASLAEVRSAVPLEADAHRRLIEALSAQAGRPVDVRVTVDPSLVGGLVVTMGDTVIDGSIARRIADVRARLVGA